MSERKLRIARLVIQPELVWDDGETMTQGPPVQGYSVLLSQAAAAIADLPREVAIIAAKLAEQEEVPTG